MKEWIKKLFSDSNEVSSKRLAGLLCCVFGIICIISLMISDIMFHYVANRLTFESIDSLFWASFAFLGVNALTQGIQSWRGK